MRCRDHKSQYYS